eukprot:IDg19258t1
MHADADQVLPEDIIGSRKLERCAVIVRSRLDLYTILDRIRHLEKVIGRDSGEIHSLHTDETRSKPDIRFVDKLCPFLVRLEGTAHNGSSETKTHSLKTAASSSCVYPAARWVLGLESSRFR